MLRVFGFVILRFIYGKDRFNEIIEKTKADGTFTMLVVFQMLLSLSFLLWVIAVINLFGVYPILISYLYSVLFPVAIIIWKAMSDRKFKKDTALLCIIPLVVICIIAVKTVDLDFHSEKNNGSDSNTHIEDVNVSGTVVADEYQEGYKTGYSKGHDTGYQEGWNDAEDKIELYSAEVRRVYDELNELYKYMRNPSEYNETINVIAEIGNAKDKLLDLWEDMY